MERSRQSGVFVVMPFGKKPVRKTRIVNGSNQSVDVDASVDVDFDDIWERLIQPALRAAGCRPYRADDEMAAGDIRTDMFFELVTGEFVLADISMLNANVFYELGIRHGVSPRGVIMIDGGWCRRPFDVAPDRTFTYTGSLFECSNNRGDSWKKAVNQEVDKLTGRLRQAIASDTSTTSSPVYKELSGLIAVDWAHIQNAKARYFGAQSHEWHARVRKAKRQRYIGDILTLSRDAPNRLFEWELRLDAAHALLDLGRFERAHELLQAMEHENPDCPKTRYALAKTLHGLAGKTQDPAEKHRYNALVESEIEEAIRRGGDDPEALRLLGRIYKYRWRNRWEHEEDRDERLRLASEHWQTAEKALGYYQDAQMFDLGLLHAGINIISLLRLRSHLGQNKPDQVDNDADLVGLVRVAARNKLRQHHSFNADNEDESDAIWANAVLGETALLTAKPADAERFFHCAATDPDVTVTQLVSFDGQLQMYELLDYKKDTVSALRKIIKDQLEFQHKKRTGGQARGQDHTRPRKLIAFRGESFSGKQLEHVVLSRIRERLKQLDIGKGDLIICGARRGAEILFAEECVRRQAYVRILLPVKTSQFVAKAVRTPDSDWERRFYQLAETCEVLKQHVRLGPPPSQLDPYERNNDWCLEIARTEFGPDVKPLVIALTVDGGGHDPINERGSVRNFMECAREVDLHVEKIVARSTATDPTVVSYGTGSLLCIRRVNDKVLKERFDKLLRIGRAEDNDVVLNEPSISRYHLELEPHIKGALLTNLSRHPGSTLLDGKALPHGEKNTVRVGFEQTLKLADGTQLTVTKNKSQAVTRKQH